METVRAGAIAGLASVLSLQPLDVLKTRLQESPKQTGHIGVGGRVGGLIRDTIRSDGIGGFWRGTLPTLGRNVPGVAVYFVTLQNLQYLLVVACKRGLPGADKFYDSQRMKPNTSGNLLLGSLARTIAGSLLMPATVLKVRFESTQYRSQYSSLLTAFRSILKREGVRGLFRGWMATTLRDAPNAGIYLGAYRWLGGGGEGIGLVGNMAAGLGAGFTATLLTHPFDLVKTRIQLSPFQGASSLAVLREILQTHGAKGLFAGLIPRMARKSLSSAITWAVYEHLMARL